ncbi:hypothetical protein Val02_41400 [Virgisporangium aliadipatigenens]|uniref:DUF6458 domain-containing protein n=1 Tax=Virgisporangium aliadipatigenens TaxID=741659 RepID=A0A8J3YKW1_9ACTN|nr:DUF6458 family protein [Virgisporangium aliadipatigenens]GIJ47254.1 hypothetical protein Val02_41400 [Virgisporangium aliadipatigenens]
MGIGGSIALLVVGAILAFAVKDTDLGGFLDLNVVGWVLILAGIVGLVLTLVFWNRRRVVVAQQPIATERRIVQEPTVTERRYTERNY